MPDADQKYAITVVATVAFVPPAWTLSLDPVRAGRPHWNDKASLIARQEDLQRGVVLDSSCETSEYKSWIEQVMVDTQYLATAGAESAKQPDQDPFKYFFRSEDASLVDGVMQRCYDALPPHSKGPTITLYCGAEPFDQQHCLFSGGPARRSKAYGYVARPRSLATPNRLVMCEVTKYILRNPRPCTAPVPGTAPGTHSAAYILLHELVHVQLIKELEARGIYGRSGLDVSEKAQDCNTLLRRGGDEHTYNTPSYAKLATMAWDTGVYTDNPYYDGPSCRENLLQGNLDDSGNTNLVNGLAALLQDLP
ncbi:MAG: hypothetical protein M1833_007146 [Piccolia ochrophora]|nr:MAG: hypothetical protein M1833_007146 [Piccolia ochrophora]